MKQDVARRVYEELKGEGYEPRLHEHQEDGLFAVSVPGEGFRLEDLKTLMRMSEDLGVGLTLDGHGRLTLA